MKDSIKERLVGEFLNKLIDHIDSKSADAAIDSNDGFDSQAGMGSWGTEEALRKATRKMFGLPVKDNDND